LPHCYPSKALVRVSNRRVSNRRVRQPACEDPKSGPSRTERDGILGRELSRSNANIEASY
jgi:hypothetical protein